MSGRALGAEETTVKKTDKILALTVFTVLLGKTDNNQDREVRHSVCFAKVFGGSVMILPSYFQKP